MAGGYKHLVGDDGRYRGTELVENMGDAKEAIDECFFIIRSWLSDEQINEAIANFDRCGRREQEWPEFMGD